MDTVTKPRVVQAGGRLRVRRVRASDMANVVALDAHVTKLSKPDYWADVFKNYGKQRLNERFFFVAEAPDKSDARLFGFIVGEVRAWEFGSTPCGWVFALSVEPDMRLSGAGSALLDAISVAFKNAGVSQMRTMVARDALLPLKFFRGEGMMAGPYIQLEKDLD